MSRKALRSLLFPVLLLVLMAGVVPVASAQSESWKVISVNSTGCAAAATTMTMEAANLDLSNPPNAITVVTVGGLIYMSENVGPIDNQIYVWSLYNSSSYGPVDAVFPLPPGQEVRIDLRLELPLGNVVYGWTLILDGCDTGNILFNGQTYPAAVASPEVCGLAVPAGSVVGEAPLGAQAYWEPGEESPGIILNPGTYIVTGQDETETYYRVVLACQFVWVRKDTMGPSWLPPQNGTALPTTIVN